MITEVTVSPDGQLSTLHTHRMHHRMRMAPTRECLFRNKRASNPNLYITSRRDYTFFGSICFTAFSSWVLLRIKYSTASVCFFFITLIFSFSRRLVVCQDGTKMN